MTGSSRTLLACWILSAIFVAAGPCSPARADGFDDADQLTVPREIARPWLDKALKTRDPELIASLPVVETNQASPAELAQLLSAVSDAGFGARQAQWVNELALNPHARLAEALGELARAQALGPFIENFPSRSRAAFLSAIVPKLASPEAFGQILVPLIVEDSDGSKLLAHRLMDWARAKGLGDKVRRELAAKQSWNGHIQQFIDEAYPTVKPLLIAHRGGASTLYPENTLELLHETMKEGLADGIEIDISVTGDNVPILWHDNDPGHFVEQVRESGLEAGNPFVPHTGCMSQPIDRTSFKAVQDLYGYVSKATKQFSPAEVPTLRRALKLVHDEGSKLKLIFLDIKTPASEKAHLATLAREIAAMVREFGLEGRVVLLHPDHDAVTFLQAHSEGAFDVCFDGEMAQPWTIVGHYTGMARSSFHEGARKYQSLGRPYFSQEGFGGYLTAVRANMDYIETTGTGQQFVSWTINDELEFREMMGTHVPVILTDKVPEMRELLKRYWP